LETCQSEISLLSQEKIGTKNNKLSLVNKQEKWVYRGRFLNAFLSRMEHVDGLTVYECDANTSFSVDKIMLSHGNSTTIVFINHVMTMERILGKNAEYIDHLPFVNLDDSSKCPKLVMNFKFTAKQQHKIDMSHTIGQVVKSIKFPDTNDAKNVIDFIKGVAADDCKMIEFPNNVSLFNFRCWESNTNFVLSLHNSYDLFMEAISREYKHYTFLQMHFHQYDHLEVQQVYHLKNPFPINRIVLEKSERGKEKSYIYQHPLKLFSKTAKVPNARFRFNQRSLIQNHSTHKLPSYRASIFLNKLT